MFMDGDLHGALLRRITEKGGFAFVYSTMLAAAGNLREAETAREMAWEQLHSGPWNEVDPTWRDAYAMACLRVADIRTGAGELQEALRVLDMGLIMGGSLFRRELDAAVEKVAAMAMSAKIEMEGTHRSNVCDLESCESWNLDEVGKNYLSSDWKQELVTFSQFLERTKSNICPANLMYLAQHPLFDQIQDLRKDIMIPDYCYAGGGEHQIINAWFGPLGTVTPLHHDPHHNIFAQVVGRKYLRLYPESASQDLYPHTESMLRNSSQVDLDNFDAKEFPRAANVEFFDCVLEEGELLYIPPKWWHYVKSLSTSFSVSFWWRAAPDLPSHV